jgi:exo-beta-1,3-glucanase (GH17 family)
LTETGWPSNGRSAAQKWLERAEIGLVKTGEIAKITPSVRKIDLSTMENLQGTSFSDDLKPGSGPQTKTEKLNQ